MPRLALYQPDIPQNVGSLVRLSACFGLPLDIIEPCGFPFDDKRLKRVAMDYHDIASITRHHSWSAFLDYKSVYCPESRLVLMTTKAAAPLQKCAFQPHDILLFGQESAGVPEEVHSAADLRILIPLQPGVRSLNIAQAAAITAFEALRQTEMT